MLLDEPFSALDALTRIEMHQLVIDLWRAHSMAVLIVTHDVDEALALADRLVVLDEGRMSHSWQITLPRSDRAPSQPEIAAARAQVLDALGVKPTSVNPHRQHTRHEARCRMSLLSSLSSRLTRRRRRPAALLAAGALPGAALLSGCGGDDGNSAAVGSDGTVDLSKVTLVVGDQKGTSAKALLTAAGLDDTPYTIEWKEFTSGPPMLEAVNADAIDVGMVGNTPPIFAAAAKGEFKMVQAVTYTGKGDALLVPKGSPIKSVAELEGKKVGWPRAARPTTTCSPSSRRPASATTRSTCRTCSPPTPWPPSPRGGLDAWAVWDPYTSQAVQSAGARVLADGDDLVNGYNFQVASDAAIEDDATKAALSTTSAGSRRPSCGPATTSEEWSRGVGPADRPRPRDHPGRGRAAAGHRHPHRQTVIDSEQEMADTFFENGLLPSKVDVERLLLRRLQRRSPPARPPGQLTWRRRRARPSTRTTGLRLHWFLPTSGDSRGLVGAGQGQPADPPAGMAGAGPRRGPALADASTTSPRWPAPPSTPASRAC